MKLKKDAHVSFRINSQVLKKIKSKKMTIQKIIDDFVDKHFSLEQKIKDKK